MSISTSFTTMFGRLPIYPRTKETQPIIGAPVLTQSTNEELSRRLGITIADFDGLPLHDPQALDVVVRRQSAESNRSSYDQTFLPLVHPCHRGDKLHEDGSNTTSADPYQYTLDRQPSPTSSAYSAQSVTSSWKTRVTRKHMPAVKPGAPGDTNIWGNTTTVTAGRPRRQRRNGSVSGILQKATAGLGTEKSSSAASPKATGFALGHVVRDKVTGKRKASGSSQAQKPQQALPTLFPDPDFESETPIITTRPPNLHCIDEWLDSRAGIHKRSSAFSTAPSNYIRSTDSLKLHIRQSTFEPLQAPRAFIAAAPDAPEMPPIPAKYLAGNTSKPAPAPAPGPGPAPTPTATITTSSTMASLPVAEAAPPPPENPAGPTDLISRLEQEQERLEVRKRELRKEVYELEMVLPPNPCSLKLEVREQLKSRLEELHGEYADAEKAAHDTGLKLYRAYRRTDKKNGVDGPTHLWVSRVTG